MGTNIGAISTKSIRTVNLTNGATAEIYSDRDALIEFENPQKYFVLTQADLASLAATPVRDAPSCGDHIALNNDSSTADEIVSRALQQNGVKQDPIFAKIFAILDPAIEKSSKDICAACHLGVSKTVVAEKLALMAKYGLAKRTQFGSGITTLWLRSQ